MQELEVGARVGERVAVLVVGCVDVVEEGVPGAGVRGVCEDVIGVIRGIVGCDGADRAARGWGWLVRAEMAQDMSFPVVDVGECFVAVQDVEKACIVVIVVVVRVIVIVIISA